MTHIARKQLLKIYLAKDDKENIEVSSIALNEGVYWTLGSQSRAAWVQCRSNFKCHLSLPPFLVIKKVFFTIFGLGRLVGALLTAR